LPPPPLVGGPQVSALEATGLAAASGTGGTAATISSRSAVEGEKEFGEKTAVEDLVMMLRQQSEEARENAAVFAKALKTQQEQYQQLFEDMQKVLQMHVQQQKPASKPHPTELSAATLQALAALMRPAGAPQESTATSGGCPVAVATTALEASGGPGAFLPGVTLPGAPAASANAAVSGLAVSVSVPAVAPAVAPPVANAVPGGDLRESFEAIGRGLQRLTWESASKGEVAKGLNTLAMLLQNVINNPTSSRHRKVNASGSRFRELLGTGGTPGAELMRLASFQFQEPNFIMGADQGVEAAQRVLDLMQDQQRNLDQVWATRSAPPDVAGGSDSQSALAVGVQGPVAVAGRFGEPDGAGGAAPVPAAGSVSAAPATQALSGLPAVVGPCAAAVASIGSVGGLPWQSSALQAASAQQQQQQQQPQQQDIAGPARIDDAATVAASELPPTSTSTAMAHPAESQEWNPGSAIAHPAESNSEASPPAVAAAPAQLLPPATLPLAYLAEAPEAEGQGLGTGDTGGSDGGAAGSAAGGSAAGGGAGVGAGGGGGGGVVAGPAVAHPAESSTPSEEPQSGG